LTSHRETSTNRTLESKNRREKRTARELEGSDTFEIPVITRPGRTMKRVSYRPVYV
jgi:hypothetical protein